MTKTVVHPAPYNHTGTIDTTTAGAVKAHFGIGQTTSIGTINVKSPIVSGAMYDNV